MQKPFPFLSAVQPGVAPASDIRPPLKERWAALLTALRVEYLNEAHEFPWVVKFSAGKDSHFLWQAVHEALVALPQELRSRAVYVVNNDTRGENPLMHQFASRRMVLIRSAAIRYGLPVVGVTTKPAPQESFWALVIGKGYPPPRARSRWCVSRLKIDPSNAFVRKHIGDAGKVIVLLGTRSDESAARAVSVAAHGGATMEEDSHLPGALNWQPIADFTTGDVWDVLLQHTPPWGGSNRDLLTLYANAKGGDSCAMVQRASDANACGGGRFGCWHCTVKTGRDESLESIVDAGNEDWEPLLELRLRLIKMRSTPGARDTISRTGIPRFDALGYAAEHGPFTMEARKELLWGLLEAQEATGLVLLSADEAAAIRAYWLLDVDSEPDRQADAARRRVERVEQQAEQARDFTLEPWSPDAE
jgi:DNA sulfur modification protein DndC